jgi:hypothetical protein
MRLAGVQACLFTSARARPRGVNLAVFDDVFQPVRPTSEERWTCTASRARVELRAQKLLGDERRHLFLREQFLVEGKLPAPGAD